MEGEIDAVSRKRRPLVVGSGLLVFVCVFLPTLRVCNDPTTPIEFPPAYIIYVGSAIIAYFGLGPRLRTVRIWIAGWFLMWGLGVVAVLTMMATDDVNGGLGFATALFGATGVGLLVRFVHRKQLAERGAFAVGIVQGLIVTGWYLLLTSDKDYMWGAYVGLTAGFLQTITSAMALSSAQAVHREQRETFPVARVIR